jgi:DNA-binding CsgD family transcriptional regulator
MINATEKQILLLLAQDYTQKEISALIFKSQSRVEKIVANLKIKLGCRRQGKLIAIAKEKGYLEINEENLTINMEKGK